MKHSTTKTLPFFIKLTFHRYLTEKWLRLFFMSSDIASLSDRHHRHHSSCRLDSIGIPLFLTFLRAGPYSFVSDLRELNPRPLSCDRLSTIPSIAASKGARLDQSHSSRRGTMKDVVAGNWQYARHLAMLLLSSSLIYPTAACIRNRSPQLWISRHFRNNSLLWYPSSCYKLRQIVFQSQKHFPDVHVLRHLTYFVEHDVCVEGFRRSFHRLLRFLQNKESSS